jgi:hypothetical protein
MRLIGKKREKEQLEKNFEEVNNVLLELQRPEELRGYFLRLE